LSKEKSEKLIFFEDLVENQSKTDFSKDIFKIFPEMAQLTLFSIYGNVLR